MAMVTVSQKGCVVILVALRNKFHWSTGDRVKVVDYGGVVSLVPVLGDPEEEGRGGLRMRGIAPDASEANAEGRTPAGNRLRSSCRLSPTASACTSSNASSDSIKPSAPLALLTSWRSASCPPIALLVFEAAHVKARYPVSYADAFSVALARRNHGRVMTGDPGFKAVESEVRVHWLPDRRR
jgi:bifunctional DNA-binding transcriptional regulator/antitoxin component of YhaV-PrlF toxin-antitoxin module